MCEVVRSRQEAERDGWQRAYGQAPAGQASDGIESTYACTHPVEPQAPEPRSTLQCPESANWQDTSRRKILLLLIYMVEREGLEPSTPA
jgi:hypothetical protein